MLLMEVTLVEKRCMLGDLGRRSSNLERSSSAYETKILDKIHQVSIVVNHFVNNIHFMRYEIQFYTEHPYGTYILLLSEIQNSFQMELGLQLDMGRLCFEKSD